MMLPPQSKLKSYKVVSQPLLKLIIMKNKDLIEKLKQYPEDMEIVSDGYEDGYDTIKDVQTIEAYRDKNKPWWNGDYNKRKIKGVEKEEILYLKAR